MSNTAQLLVHEAAFDENNPNWSNDSVYNIVFLRSSVQYLSYKLESQGHLFLNEVLDLLGFPRTRPGVVNGWMHDPKKSKPVITFEEDEQTGVITVRFVVDGEIHEKI